MHPNAIVSESNHSRTRSACLVILSSILIGLFAKAAIPLPFTPIPIATQGSIVLLLSCVLGSRRSFAAVLGFLIQGAAGLPVFAEGAGGLAVLFGPRGGYLIGYLAAAWLVGHLAETAKNRTPANLFLILSAGTAMFFLFGVPYLATFIGFKKALILGALPFLLGDLLKIFACIKILQWFGWAAKR